MLLTITIDVDPTRLREQEEAIREARAGLLIAGRQRAYEALNAVQGVWDVLITKAVQS